MKGRARTPTQSAEYSVMRPRSSAARRGGVDVRAADSVDRQGIFVLTLMLLLLCATNIQKPVVFKLFTGRTSILRLLLLSCCHLYMYVYTTKPLLLPTRLTRRNHGVQHGRAPKPSMTLKPSTTRTTNKKCSPHPPDID